MLLRLLRLAAVAALAVVVYRNTLPNQFVYDDGAQILRNHYIRDGSHLRAIFTTNVWSFLGPHAVSNYYRPMQHLIYMGDYRLFGYSPAGYHATSILFHALNAALVLLLGEALLLPSGIAFAGAALFAVHPITTEAVAWVAGIPELSYTLFFLLSLLLYIRGRVALSAMAALFALFSKETALMVLPAIVIYEHLFRESSESHLRRALRYSGHIAAVTFYVFMRIYSLGGFQVSDNPYGVLPRWQFLLSAVYLLGKYVAKLFVPWPLNIFYVFHPARSVFDWRVWAGAVSLLAVAAAAVLLWRKRQPIAYAAVLLLLPLVPTLDLRAIGHNVFTERYLYLPAAAFCLCLGYFLVRTRRALGWVVLVVIVSAYSILTITRNRDWHDDLRLYTATLQVSPESNLIRDNLGRTYLDGFGQPERAAALFQECIQRGPVRAEYYVDLGNAYGEMRRYDDAMSALDHALELWPDYPEAYMGLGDLYRDQGNLDDAAQEYRQALRVKPTWAEAMDALGYVEHQRGNRADAEQWFRKALAITDLAGAHLDLGLLYLDEGRNAEAEREFRSVLISEPHSVAAWYGLANALRALGRNAEAADCYATALNERKYAHPRRLGRTPIPELRP